MKRLLFIVVSSIVVLFITASCVPTGGGSETTSVATTLGNRIAATEGKISTLEARLASAEARIPVQGAGGATQAEVVAVKASLDAAKAELATFKTETAATLATLTSKIATVETKVAGVPINQQPQQNPVQGTQGQVTFQIVNQQQWYTFGTGTVPLNVKIINMKADTRYVRPTLSVTTFQNSNAGTWDAAQSSITIMSNSMGQPAIIFTPTASPVGAVTNAIYIPTSGGSNNTGEYMITPGSSMDIWINIKIITTNSVMWTANMSGSDRPLY